MKYVTLIGTVSDAFLGMLKTLLGIFGHSQALLADGINSLSDLATDGMILLASKSSTQIPDEEHPYGHGRIETIASVVLAIIIIFVGIGIAADTIHAVIHQHIKKPSILVLVAAIISIVLNESLFRHMQHVGNRINSSLIQANAWHKRSDALTSTIVLVGIIGELIGLPYFDAGAAVIVAIIIFYAGIKMILINIHELIETGVDFETSKTLLTLVKKTPGVQSAHQLRTRLIGGQIFIDIHIQVDPYLSVSEAHYIADTVEKTLLDHSPKIEDVVIHIDPENDDGFVSTLKLPNRKTLLKNIHKFWKNLKGFKDIEKITLHYLNNEIEMDVFLPMKFYDPKLTQAYQKALIDIPEVVSVTLFWTGN